MKNAIELLKRDHKHVKTLLAQLKETTSRATKARQELLAKIEVELRAHMRIEEEIFYPALRDAAETNEQREMLAEAYEEHRAIEKLILPDLKKTDVSSETFGGRTKVLKEMIEHHIDEEEEEMFPFAEGLLSEEQLRELGEQMHSRKNEILEQKRSAA